MILMPQKVAETGRVSLNWREDNRDPAMIDGRLLSWGPHEIDHLRG